MPFGETNMKMMTNHFTTAIKCENWSICQNWLKLKINLKNGPILTPKHDQIHKIVFEFQIKMADTIFNQVFFNFIQSNNSGLYQFYDGNE